MADTISVDLTPEGMKTPEGKARVNTAMQRMENTTATAADALAEFLKEFDQMVILGNIQIRNKDSNEMEYFRECYQDAERSIAVRKAAQNEFLKAVAGI